MLLDTEARELRVRVAAGVEPELWPKIRVRIGEGIAGRVAADARPLRLRGKADRQALPHRARAPRRRIGALRAAGPRGPRAGRPEPPPLDAPRRLLRRRPRVHRAARASGRQDHRPRAGARSPAQSGRALRRRARGPQPARRQGSAGRTPAPAVRVRRAARRARHRERSTCTIPTKAISSSPPARWRAAGSAASTASRSARGSTARSRSGGSPPSCAARTAPSPTRRCRWSRATPWRACSRSRRAGPTPRAGAPSRRRCSRSPPPPPRRSPPRSARRASPRAPPRWARSTRRACA